MKLKLLLSVVALAVLIGGAYIAYDALSEQGGSNLQILDDGKKNPPAEDSPAENPPADDPPADNSSEENPAENPTEEKPQLQPSAPDFTVLDASGNAVKLSDYFGKPIVLNFFASWCGPCRKEMPAFQAEYNARGEEIVFLFVSVDDTMKDAKDFIDGQGYTFPILHDKTGSAAVAYAIRSIPATYFISKEGHVVAQAVGALSAADLALGIEKIK